MIGTFSTWRSSQPYKAWILLPVSTPAMAAIAKLEKISEDIDAAAARRKSNQTLPARDQAWQHSDFVRSAQLSLAATNSDDTNAKAFQLARWHCSAWAISTRRW